MAEFTAGNRAIHFIDVTSTNDFVQSYQGTDNTTTDAQYALISAGAPGTDGVLDGVVCKAWEEITVSWVDNDPVTGDTVNCGGPVYAGPGGLWDAPTDVGVGSFSANLGAPPAADDDYIVVFTLPASGTIDVTEDELTAQPPFPCCPTIKGTEADQTQEVTITGTDIEGNEIEETEALNGTSAVTFSKAFKKITNISSTARNDAGEDVKVGISEVLGLPVRMDHNGVIKAVFGTTVEATAPTVTFDASVISKNTVDLNTALDGAHQVIVDGIRCDAPLDPHLM